MLNSTPTSIRFSLSSHFTHYRDNTAKKEKTLGIKNQGEEEEDPFLQPQHQPAMDLVSSAPTNTPSSAFETPSALAISTSNGTGANNSNSTSTTALITSPSRYENQKRRDWNTFCQYLRNHRPPLSLPMCSGAHVLEFLRYLDQFGKTKIHNHSCPFFGLPNPPAPCPCPLRQAWGSLDALIGRLRAAYEEHGGRPEANPFGARAVRLYLREVRDFQSKARGVSYDKKRKRPKPRPTPVPTPTTSATTTSTTTSGTTSSSATLS